jgi:hypothetical protein
MKEGINMFLVDESSALCLWEDEVEEEEKSKPGVEWDPGVASGLEWFHIDRDSVNTM